MSKKSADELKASLIERRNQIDARIRRIDAKERTVERKKDTRRKIIIGGAAITLQRRGELTPAKLLAYLDETLTRDDDRKLMAEFLPPKRTN